MFFVFLGDSFVVSGFLSKRGVENERSEHKSHHIQVNSLFYIILFIHIKFICEDLNIRLCDSAVYYFYLFTHS